MAKIEIIATGGMMAKEGRSVPSFDRSLFHDERAECTMTLSGYEKVYEVDSQDLKSLLDDYVDGFGNSYHGHISVMKAG